MFYGRRRADRHDGERLRVRRSRGPHGAADRWRQARRSGDVDARRRVERTRAPVTSPCSTPSQAGRSTSRVIPAKSTACCGGRLRVSATSTSGSRTGRAGLVPSRAPPPSLAGAPGRRCCSPSGPSSTRRPRRLPGSTSPSAISRRSGPSRASSWQLSRHETSCGSSRTSRDVFTPGERGPARPAAPDRVTRRRRSRAAPLRHAGRSRPGARPRPGVDPPLP
jgi:hypothetical protein